MPSEKSEGFLFTTKDTKGAKKCRSRVWALARKTRKAEELASQTFVTFVSFVVKIFP
jgi:hypothetical protein